MVDMDTAKVAVKDPDSYSFDLGNRGTRVISISKIVNIDVNNLNSEFANHGAKYLEFAVIASIVKERRDRAIEELKYIESKTDTAIRELAKSAGEKITEASVRARVDTDEIVLSHKHKLFEIETELSIASAIKEAFYQRKDMLVSLGANLRAEMEAEIHINKKGLVG